MAKNWWTGETPPTYYGYHGQTNEFVEAGACDPSPLEPGVWLVPGSATLEMPPTLGPKLAAVWNGEKWVATPDHRGEVRWLDKQFVVIKDLGDPVEWGLADLVVHDAEYWLPEGSTDPNGAMIRMRVNDDEITFVDDPNVIARKVLAAWEAQGETIRPIRFDDSAFEAPEPPMPITTPEEDAVRRLDQLRQDMDKLAQQGVEGIPVPQEEHP